MSLFSKHKPAANAGIKDVNNVGVDRKCCFCPFENRRVGLANMWTRSIKIRRDPDPRYVEAMERRLASISHAMAAPGVHA